MTYLYTTLGPKRADELGMILPHEHIFVDLRTWDQPGYGEAEPGDVVARMGPEVEAAQAAGVTTLVDCGPIGVGRRVDILQRVSEATGFPIVSLPTGIYREPWVTPWAHASSEDTLYGWMCDELDGNIVGSGVRAGFIKLSVGDDGLTEAETQILRAGTRAAVATGATIGSHTIRGGAWCAIRPTSSRGWAAPCRGASSGFTPRPSRISICTWRWQSAAAGSNTTTAGPGGRRGAYCAHPADAGSGLRRSTAVEPRHGWMIRRNRVGGRRAVHLPQHDLSAEAARCGRG